MTKEDEKENGQIDKILKGTDGKITKFYPRTVKFTPLVMLIDQILAQIKDERYFK